MFGSLVGSIVSVRGASDVAMSLIFFFSSVSRATVAKPDAVLVPTLSSSIEVIFFCIGSIELFGSCSTDKVPAVLGLVSNLGNKPVIDCQTGHKRPIVRQWHIRQGFGLSFLAYYLLAVAAQSWLLLRAQTVFVQRLPR